jgi:hypothetical protein
MAAGQQVVPVMTGQTESNAPGTDQQAPAPEADEDVWDEERLDQAMKTLKEMHIQASHIESTHPRQKLTRFFLKLRNLRTTIPRLIAPLTTKQPSRMYKSHDPQGQPTGPDPHVPNSNIPNSQCTL